MILRNTLVKTVLCALLAAATGPAAARFLSPDPEPADHESFNRYWYANNNPYTYVDPDGRCAKVTGSHVCNSSTAAAAMAKTALEPQTFTSSMVTHVGPKSSPETARKETAGMVADANKAGRVAQLSGDSRTVRAINKVSQVRIDSSDWAKGTFQGTQLPRSTIAYVDFGLGRLTFNSQRYFSGNTYFRVGRFLHEALHLDGDFNNQRILEQNRGCAAWGCQFELDVEVYAGRIMRGNYSADPER